jgi:molybdopterin-guanine dinucleotide biosynthesis protein A
VFLDERREAGQPLVAWYSMEVLPVVEAAIADRDLAMTRFTERLGGVHYLRADAVHLTRPLDAVFLNVNRPSDLEVAREYLQHYPDP